MKKEIYKILRTVTGNTDMLTGLTYQIPLYLEEKYDNMGVMSLFDGNMEQIEQYCNFSYSGNNQTIIIYNTTNINKYKSLIGSEYKINWGDGSNSTLNMPTVYDVNLPSVSHTYAVTGDTIIEITINTPWKVNNVKKTIKLPFVSSYGWPTDLGTLGFSLPYNPGADPVEIDYLQDYTTLTATTKHTNISFISTGKSRLNEYKVYGTGNTYSITTTIGTTDLGNYTGYTIDGLSYFDYENGYTHITGSTSGTTEFPYINEEVYNGMITRNEILLGFIEEPQIFSDLFIERGKQSVIERNLRLGEIDNMGELEIYGGGYFNVKKQ
jgi:hypothetical protein